MMGFLRKFFIATKVRCPATIFAKENVAKDFRLSSAAHQQ